MMHPMRVEWTVPDDLKRETARAQMERDIESWRSGMPSKPDLRRVLIVSNSPEERNAALVRHYPDLHADIVHYGTLLSIRYVPEQWGVRTFVRGGLDLGTTGSAGMKLCDAKWVALVATADGTVEMDPRTLRVMWPMSAGDPIGGVVSAEELARRGRSG